MMKFLTLVMILLNGVMITLPKATSDGSYGDYYDHNTNGVLGFDVYKDICPEVEAIIFSWVQRAVMEDSRMAASLLRLHFHDCFGCDGSVLLDDSNFFVGEKTAAPNFNSLRGFEVVDAIKSELETLCPETVSCADILAIAARDSVLLARCSTFSARLQSSSVTSPPAFIESLQQLCSESTDGDGDGGNTLAQLDLVTPATFDNQYYVNLVSGEGLLPSDQVLVTGDDQARDIVITYAQDPFVFFEDFQSSMLKMGSVGVITGTSGEIRRDCRRAN
ncbi:hypothetical protein TIFTF001_024249 [Ficus carica]|uniref:peroxidase n=1 Tax=Ficus carica TaxID=3494 RepID=A0AA88AXX2_FICCA|nr:hypothetical protein TIFTF001_024249 [Ficus carica]